MARRKRTFACTTRRSSAVGKSHPCSPTRANLNCRRTRWCSTFSTRCRSAHSPKFSSGWRNRCCKLRARCGLSITIPCWKPRSASRVFSKKPAGRRSIRCTGQKGQIASAFFRLKIHDRTNYHIPMPVDTEVPTSSYTRIRAPRGTTLSCKGWQQEAAMRMLMNNLDEEVGERPRDLVVYGGTGKAARNWDCYHAIVRSLKDLENDETLLVQSGKPVGVFKTHDYAPRVLIANSNLVGHFSNWEKFNELERAGLMMYGQMTAGSWIYIGSQGIVQGTYETFSAAGDKQFGGDLSGKLIVSGGMGGMGGAQPLAATMTGAAFLGIDVDAERIKKRIKTGYCDFLVTTLDEALRILKNAVRKKENISVGLVGNCADIIPELAERGVVPDILTDQTSAHDPLNG